MKTSRSLAAAGIALTFGLVTACSSSGSSAGPRTTSSPVAPSTTTVARSAGPAAMVAPLTGGRGVSLVSANAVPANADVKSMGDRPDIAVDPAIAKAGWVQDEYSASGTAVGYKGATPTDGMFTLSSTGSAAYKTRFVVRRPKLASDFNGTVVVEWLNVSGGLDAAPDWTYTEAELIRSGYAWVGVSAQKIGVEGGTVAVSTPVSALAGAGKGIRTLDPARYSSLHHPGDAYSYDMFTQVARALRAPGKVDALGPLKPTHVLAMGESQSAFMLTTYVDGVQPLTHEFDGFLIHSRGGAAAPLGKPGGGVDIASSLSGKPTHIRTDTTAPVIMVQTESDVAGILAYLPATQPDSANVRLWEVAGTAHVDRFQLGPIADKFGCVGLVNDGPDNFIVSSALAHLDAWASKGVAPPKAARLVVDKAGKYVTDANGNVRGGIRTPLVDVPVDKLSGIAAPGGSVACLLSGQTVPLSAARLATLYPSRSAYLAAYSKSTDAAVKSGFVLPADRKALLARAQPDRIAG